MSKNIHSIIKTEYEKRQKEAYDNLMLRKRDIYEKIPRIEEIDSSIQGAGIRYNKLILLGNSSTEETAAELFSTIEELKREKQRLLVGSGFPENCLEMIYKCPQCRDTGFLEGPYGAEKCACYKQQLINNLFNLSNLKLAETENFSCFDEKLYPDAVNESKYGIPESPRENILNIKERCLKFVENFEQPQERNLFFSGPTGVGKTFMSNCIAMEIIKKGRTVLYQTAPKLFDIINEYKLKAFSDDGYEDSSYKNIFDVELLIIDDLGTEPQSAARFAELLNILNTRQMNNSTKPCKTIISTNIGVKELYDYYKERIASRIIGGFDVFKFAGEDIRRLKKLRKLQYNG